MWIIFYLQTLTGYAKIRNWRQHINNSLEVCRVSYNVEGGELAQGEAEEYIRMLRAQHPDRIIKNVTFKVDGEFVDVSYTYDMVPFDRIRRITGYLVGSLDRFNDAKHAEVFDRVDHSIV